MKNSIELNKKYTTKEIQNILGVSSSNWKSRKQDFLDSLALAYNYTIEQKGSYVYYTFTEQLSEYEPPLKKHQKEKVEAFIEVFIHDTINQDPKQTAANLNRYAWDIESPITAFGLKPSTTQQYIRKKVKEMYGTYKYIDGQLVITPGTHGMITRKVWCRLDKNHNKYIELPQEQIDLFLDYYDETRGKLREIDSEIFEDYKNKTITRKEMLEQLGDCAFNAYLSAKRRFEANFGFTPIKVPVFMNKDKGEFMSYEF